MLFAQKLAIVSCLSIIISSVIGQQSDVVVGKL
jgi:hypothetical protein